MSPDEHAHRITTRQKSRTRFRTGVAAPCRDDADLDHRRRRHVVGGGGAAAGAGRIRRAAGGSVAAVHPGDDRICLGRRGHGPPVRPDRDFGSAGAWRRGAQRRLSRCRERRQPRGVRTGACRDRLRHLGDARSADRRHLELVRPPPRRRGDAVLGRKLCRRHGVAAGRAARHRALRLARDPCRHRADLRRGDAAHRRRRFAPARAGSAPRRRRRGAQGNARSIRPVRAGAADAAGAGFGLLLRRHVDAAGPHRRLLRRSRLRRRPRRRHAGADDGVRHRRAHRLRLHRRPGRRSADA